MTTAKLNTWKNLLSVSILSVSILTANVAYAQIEQQVGIADPSRAGENISEQRLIPQASPKISVQRAALQKAPEGAENIKFNFSRLQANGVSIYTAAELAPLYVEKVGTEISLADLYDIANDITLKYRRDGYVLTQAIVPPQTIDSGIPQIQVVEGFISDINIQGGDENPEALKVMQNYSNQINSNNMPLNIKEMERQLLLINDLPGVSARTVISPSKQAGAADMLIIIDRDKYEATASIDNHGSRFLGPVQLGVTGVANSPLGLNERITAQAVIAPDSGIELGYGALGWEQPVGRHGTTLSLGGSFTRTDPGFTLSQFDVVGLSRRFHVGATHPIVRSRNTNVYSRLFLDFNNVESENDVEAKREDNIRALRAGLKADFLDRLLGVAVNSVDFEISQGLDIFGASDKGDANLTRELGDPDFTKANIRLERLQRVSNNFNILFAGRGQWSDSPLLSSEEFGLGGYNTVRGFDPSEVVGDEGIAGKVEVQWNPDRIDHAQLFTFVDSGTVWEKDPTTAANKRNSLTSVGLGVRLDLTNNVHAEFTAAQPLHRDVATQGERDPQFFFRLTKSF